MSRPVRPDLRADSRSAALPSGAPPSAAPLDAAPLEAAPLEAAPPNAAPPGAGPPTTPGPHPDAAPSSTAEVPWRRLDPRMLVVAPGRRARPAAARVRGGAAHRPRGRPHPRLVSASAPRRSSSSSGCCAGASPSTASPPDRVELHSGWLRRQRRSVPRDRIRTVDLTARLEHRIFGLSVVKIGSATGGTGEHAGLALDAVSKAEADRLRRELLDRSPVAGSATPAAAPPSDRAGPPATGRGCASPRSRSPRWPGSASWRARCSTSSTRRAPTPARLAGDAVERLARTGLAAAIGLIAVTVLAAAVIGSLLLFAERWYGYRLTREPDGTLRVRRGLLTRRSLSVSERRLRGVEVVRAAAAARRARRADQGAVGGAHQGLPGRGAAAAGAAGRGAPGGVGRGPSPAGGDHLRAAAAAPARGPAPAAHPGARTHPRARGRRVRRRRARARPGRRWCCCPRWRWSAGTAPACWATPSPAATWWPARARSCARTVALQRSGVIGWRVRQSPFQRRAGVVTVEAVTAAGARRLLRARRGARRRGGADGGGRPGRRRPAHSDVRRERAHVVEPRRSATVRPGTV